jgi:hypothetical protein
MAASLFDRRFFGCLRCATGRRDLPDAEVWRYIATNRDSERVS